MALGEDEIRRRFQELRNERMLHLKARERVLRLEAENKLLKRRIRELEDRNDDQNRRIEAMAYELEQVKVKLFGKKPLIHLREKQDKRERDAASYRRPIPKTVTETKHHPITACAHCNRPLTKKHTATFFEEDVPLPIPKIVIKHEVEVGYCASCKLQSSGYPVPSKRVILGEKVRKYVCVLSIANRLSHSQIKNHLKDVFDLKVSLGEIDRILAKEAHALAPEYESLKTSVSSQRGIHHDETSWKVQKEEQGKYAWVATGTENNDAVFSLGKSRGRGNIEPHAGVGISDDYGAYKNTFAFHQLCWAHPLRKLRDLAESQSFNQTQQKRILAAYEQFSTLYRAIKKRVDTELSPYLKKRFRMMFDLLSESYVRDPAPLARIKASLRKNKEKYFTFLAHPGIPLDNNKAERALRHLVIKRRISFGSKTQRGADTTSILASVILSLKWNRPTTWFTEYFQTAS